FKLNRQKIRAKAAARVETSGAAGSEDIFTRMREFIAAIRALLDEAAQEHNPASRQKKLNECREQLRSLLNAASGPKWVAARQMASGLDGLLKQMADRPNNYTSSTVQAANAGVDLLADLVRPEVSANLNLSDSIQLLVVDDDLI